MVILLLMLHPVYSEDVDKDKDSIARAVRDSGIFDAQPWDDVIQKPQQAQEKAAVAIAANQAAKKSNLHTELEKIAERITTETVDAGHLGSGSFLQCQGYANVDWKDLVANKASNLSNETFSSSWKKFITDELLGPAEKAADNDDNSRVSAAVARSIAEKSKNYLNKLQFCHAYAIVTSYSNTFDDSDMNKHTKESMDKKLNCNSAGQETQDYSACGNLINAYDATIVGQKAMEGLQYVDQEKTSVDSQITMLKTQEEDAAAALKAMREGINKKKDISTQTTGFHATKLAALFAMYNAMPTKKEVYDYCIGKFGGDTVAGKVIYDEIIQAVMTPGNSLRAPANPNFKPSPERACAKAASNNNVIMNDDARDSARALMVEAGVDAAKFGAITALLDHQLDDVDDAIAAVEDYEPTDNAALQQQDLLIEQCAADPSLEICQTGGYINPVGFMNGRYDLGGSGGDTIISGSTDPDDSGTNNATASGPTDRSGMPVPLGEIPGELPNGSSFLGPAPAAAKAKDGSSGASGGGGGGVSAGAEGLVGGDVTGQPQKGGGTQSSVTDSEKQYVGGRGAYASKGGGSSAKKDDKNPFADMFGKKVEKKNDPNSLDFGRAQISRDPASIFLRISDRYGEVVKEKRLLEYVTLEDKSTN